MKQKQSVYAVFLLAVAFWMAPSLLADHHEFVPLFDGKTLKGWQGKDELWSVRDGAIVGSSLPDGVKKNTFLISNSQYTNFVLRIQFKYTGGNSGVLFRTQRIGEADAYKVAGFQADVADKYMGNLHDEARRGILVKADLDWLEPFYKKNDWNSYEITAIGNRITIKLNNKLYTARYVETDESIPQRGHIALQMHRGPGLEVGFKDISIREIKPKRVLFTTHAAGFAHSSRPTARRVLEKLGRDSGYFEAVVTDGVELLNPEDLGNFDCVGFYTTGDLNKFPLSRENREFLIEWVKSGKAFFGTHSATDTYKDWEPYWEMIGGSFAGHPWGAKGPAVTIDVEDPSHPSAQHLDSQWVIQDEMYQFKNYSRDRLHVILSLNPKEHARGSVPHGDYPVAWCRDFGKGKVFYTSLGHRENVWTNPVYQEHLLGGILWSLGIEGYEGSAVPGRKKAANDWVDLFDGSTLSGWRANDAKRSDTSWDIVEGGILRSTGGVSHFFSPQRYRNFHYRADARVFDDSNSGMYFRAQLEPEVVWPNGMEAQVNSNHGDRKRSGTLYSYEAVYEQLTRPGEWFTQEVIAVDEYVVIKVNGQVTVKRRVPFDQKKHFPEGRFAFQAHHPGSTVEYRNVEVRELP